jgi:hypothetical protein
VRGAVERIAPMDSRITEVARDTYRISTFHPGYKMRFDQLLVKDDVPFLACVDQASCWGLGNATAATS